MTSKRIDGPINSGTIVTQNITDERKSRTEILYMVSETDAAVARLTTADAITYAISQAALDSKITRYGSIPLETVTAQRFGEKKVRVTLRYGNTTTGTPGQDPGSTQVLGMQLRAANVRVYRRPFSTRKNGEALRYDCDGTAGSGNCSSSSSTCYDSDLARCVSPAIKNGLPDGDWIGGIEPSKVPSFSSAAYIEFANWPVPEVRLQIPARLTNAEFQGLFAANKLFDKVGYFNSATFTWNSIGFTAGTVRIDGANVDWLIEGTTPVYYVNYDLTWRPYGWYVQELVQLGSDSSKADTSIINVAEPRVSFTDMFPL